MTSKSTFRNYHCDKLKRVINLELKWGLNKEGNSITGADIIDCSHAKLCGVIDENDSYSWNKCPVYGSRELESLLDFIPVAMLDSCSKQLEKDHEKKSIL